MKRLIFIPLLILSLTLSAQFGKSGSTFLKTGSSFMTITAAEEPEVEYGDEMITNGNFTSFTGWSIVATGWSEGSGNYVFDDEAPDFIHQSQADLVGDAAIVQGTTYKLEFDIGISGGNLANIFIGDYTTDATYFDYDDYANGHHTLQFTAPATTVGGISFYATSANNETTFTLDNVSLKEVL